jgi:hypothetical protein
MWSCLMLLYVGYFDATIVVAWEGLEFEYLVCTVFGMCACGGYLFLHVCEQLGVGVKKFTCVPVLCNWAVYAKHSAAS